MPAAPKYNLQEHIDVNSAAWDTEGTDRYDHISSPHFNTDAYKAAANQWIGSMP